MCAVKLNHGIELRAAEPASLAAKGCLGHYYRELDAVFEGGFDPDQKAYAGTGAATPPNLYCVLAWAGEEPVGCGFLQWQEGDAIVEIKRMWVAREARARASPAPSSRIWRTRHEASASPPSASTPTAS